MLVKKYKGKVPNNFSDLEKLPGVGHKTASVVMSQGLEYLHLQLIHISTG